MAIDTLFGVETEYAITGRARSGVPYPRDVIAAAMLTVAREQLASVTDSDDRGVFLSNGGRFLIDAGAHPEFATPECLDPWELVRYLKAGDRIVAGLAEAARTLCPGLAEVEVFRTNCDLGPPAKSWACHENYYCRSRSPRHLRRVVLPHLVSRLVLTGAGGFRPGYDRLQYTLSPRSWFLAVPTSDNTTDQRGIFNERNEPLGQKGHRLHVIAGDSNCSDVANILKVGTTALVVALADRGRLDRCPLDIGSAVRALRVFAADPRCRARVPSVGGATVSAIEIQRHYLHAAEQQVDELPAWAGAVCAMWRSHLDQLESEPGRAWSLDWVAKRAVVTSLAGQLGTTRLGDQPITSPAAAALRQLEWRFAQVAPPGLADQAVRAGALGGRQVSDVEIKTALTWPPRRTRAWHRGAAIREVSTDPDRRSEAQANWDYVSDPLGNGFLSLDDPFQGAGTELAWVSGDPVEAT